MDAIPRSSRALTSWRWQPERSGQLSARQGTARKEKLELLKGPVVLLFRMETLPMHITTETMALLWLGAGAVALWMWLPAVLNALGLTLWHGSMDDDAAALEPSGSDAADDEL